MNTTLVLIAACIPLVVWFAYRLAATRRPPMPDMPDDIGVTPATEHQPAILWERHGHTLSRHAAPGTQLPAGEDQS
ncbi:hypothetical protein ACGF07_25625 [Kitasatospora sp. NPDC048194]|uniref:hypothetical protein n=1 Tax=Kitasatospora sp. NPDC048194 TaxID=3364045 RepID=UPI00371B784B